MSHAYLYNSNYFRYYNIRSKNLKYNVFSIIFQYIFLIIAKKKTNKIFMVFINHLYLAIFIVFFISFKNMTFPLNGYIMAYYKWCIF